MFQGSLKPELLFYVGLSIKNQISSQTKKQVRQLVLQGRNQNLIDGLVKSLSDSFSSQTLKRRRNDHLLKLFQFRSASFSFFRKTAYFREGRNYVWTWKKEYTLSLVGIGEFMLLPKSDSTKI
jgi:hypothetical protein